MRNAAANTNTTHETSRSVANGRPSGSPPDLPGLTDIQPLGRRGDALRFRALQPVTGRPVEVLVLEGRPEPRTVQGFVRDGTIGARLSGQSGVVPVFDAGVTPSGLHYLVRPYYSRGSLGRHLTDAGPLPWRKAVSLVEQIAATTSEIHSWGIVHQGLEPGNIMLTEFLGPMVGAFGSSLPVGADLVIGANPSDLGPYAAPELGRGGAANATIDVYSLGAILWALLAGRDPEHPSQQPVPVPHPGTPEPLVQLLRRAMSRRVHERPATATAFAADLKRCVHQIEHPTAPGDQTAAGGQAPPGRAPVPGRPPVPGHAPGPSGQTGQTAPGRPAGPAPASRRAPTPGAGGQQTGTGSGVARRLPPHPADHHSLRTQPTAHLNGGRSAVPPSAALPNAALPNAASPNAPPSGPGRRPPSIVPADEPPTTNGRAGTGPTTNHHTPNGAAATYPGTDGRAANVAKGTAPNGVTPNQRPAFPAYAEGATSEHPAIRLQEPPQRQREPQPDLMSRPDTRYILLLVAAIAVVIVWMVTMAMVGVG